MAQFTNEGEQYIADKAGSNGEFLVTHFVLANIVDLDYTSQPPIDSVIPADEFIVDVQPVTQSGYLNANQTVYSLVLDSSIGDYEFNWIGLKTDDGRLLSVAYDAPQQKLRYDGLQEGNNITRNFVIEFEGAADAAAITVSAETWQIDYTARLNQIDENQRLVGRDMFGASTFFGSGFAVELEGSDHVVKAGLGYIEGIRLFLAADINLGSLADKSIWVDAAIVNDSGIVLGVFDTKVSAFSAIEEDYFSTEQHYLLKIAQVNYNGAITDTRNVMDEEIEEGGVTAGLKTFTKNEVAALSSVISEMFAGQVSTFPGTAVPRGWLKANGAEVLRSEYPYLWNYANSSGNIAASDDDKTAGQFGVGDGVNTFTLPDLRGQHPRYWDDGRGVDDGRLIASEQADEIKEHKHSASSANAGSHNHSATSANAGSHSHSYVDWAYNKTGSVVHDSNNNWQYGNVNKTTGQSGNHNHTISVANAGEHKHTISVENTGIEENRVKNVALMVCIKY